MGLSDLLSGATSRASAANRLDDASEPDLDDRLDEATGEMSRLVDFAELLQADIEGDDSDGDGDERYPDESEGMTSAQRKKLRRAFDAYLGDEPVAEDEEPLIPFSTQELEALRTLGKKKHNSFKAMAGRGGAGAGMSTIAKWVGEASAAVPAAQIPAVINAGHTALQAVELQGLSERVPLDAGVYRTQDQAKALRKAIERASRIRSAKASGQVSSILTSVGGNLAAPAATEALLALLPLLAVAPVAVPALAVSAGSIAASVGAGKIVGAVLRKVRDVDRVEIAKVLWECARYEVEHNEQAEPAVEPANEGEHDPNQTDARPRVEEYAVRALYYIGVSRELVMHSSADYRAREIIVLFLS